MSQTPRKKTKRTAKVFIFKGARRVIEWLTFFAMKNQANILAYERQRLFVFGGLAAFFGQANGDDTIEDVFLLSRFSRLVLGKFWSLYENRQAVSRTRPEFKKSLG